LFQAWGCSNFVENCSNFVKNTFRDDGCTNNAEPISELYFGGLGDADHRAIENAFFDEGGRLKRRSRRKVRRPPPQRAVLITPNHIYLRRRRLLSSLALNLCTRPMLKTMVWACLCMCQTAGAAPTPQPTPQPTASLVPQEPVRGDVLVHAVKYNISWQAPSGHSAVDVILYYKGSSAAGTYVKKVGPPRPRTCKHAAPVKFLLSSLFSISSSL